MEVAVWQWILTICGGIITVSGAAAVIVKWVTPAFRMTRRVRDIEEKQLKDYKSITATKDMTALVCKALLRLIEHEVSGNSVDKLKEVKAEIQD